MVTHKYSKPRKERQAHRNLRVIAAKKKKKPSNQLLCGSGKNKHISTPRPSQESVPEKPARFIQENPLDFLYHLDQQFPLPAPSPRCLKGAQRHIFTSHNLPLYVTF